MANGNYENMCRTLSRRSSEDDITNNEVVCIMCERIISNACNGLCGCKYCWECIEDYLDGEERCCPGELDECKNQLLNIENNVLIVQAVDSEISRIIVKCPDQIFKSEEEPMKSDFQEIENNLAAINLAFLNNGCDETKSVNGEVEEYLNLQSYSYTNVLMEWIDNLRKEMKSLKLDLLNSQKDNRNLRKELELVKFDIQKQQTVLSELHINDKVKTAKINYLLQKLHLTTEDINSMEYPEAIGINEKIKNLNNKVSRLELNQDKQNYGEYVWVIDKISEKITAARKVVNKEIYSDYFFSHRNGYKMCLRLDPIGLNMGKGSYLAIYFCIVRGPFDDILSWPMQHAVTFALINQQTGLVHTSRTMRYDDVPDNFAWNKPTCDKKTGFGYHKFISMDELMDNDNLCRNDQIFITCSVYT